MSLVPKSPILKSQNQVPIVILDLMLCLCFFLSTLSKSLVLHYIIVIVRVIFPTVIIINELWVTRTRGNGGWAQCIADINRDACTCQTFMKISAWSYYSDFVHRSPYCSWQRHIWLSLIDLKLQLLKAAATWIFLTDFITHSTCRRLGQEWPGVRVARR